MHTLSRQLAGIFVFITLVGFQHCPGVTSEPSTDRFVDDALGALKVTSPADLQQATFKASELCDDAIAQLSETAVGYALCLDLDLNKLREALSEESLDLELLEAFEQRLRLLAPDSDQIVLNELRRAIGKLRRLALATEASVERASQGLERLKSYLERSSEASLNSSEIADISEIYAQLHSTNLSSSLLESLRSSLSFPNAITRVRKRTIEEQYFVDFSIPVRTSVYQDRTNIAAEGTIDVRVDAKIPNHASAIPLIIQVSGDGTIQASIDRGRAHVNACIQATASGTQPLEIGVKTIEPGMPRVDSRLNSAVQRVRLDGRLNNRQVLRNVLARIAQRELSRQDQAISQKIETQAVERAEEEGYRLATKINSLIKSAIWSRLESVDLTPSVQLAVDSEFIHSASLYAFSDQLGASRPPPQLAAEVEEELDLITSIHESAINNVFERLSGGALDEATVRGLWQVQFKLMCSAWEQPKVARVPSVVTFASSKPISFRWVDDSAEFTLRLRTGCLAGGRQELPACQVSFRYRLGNQGNGFVISRSPFEFTTSMPGEEQETWAEVLERFFPESVYPIPRFRTSAWENYVALRHLNAESGWLTIGLSSVQAPAAESSKGKVAGADL